MLLQALALAWLIGSGVAALGLPLWPALGAALVGLQWWRRGWWRLAAIAIVSAGLSLGAAAWYQRHLPTRSPTDVSHFVDEGPTRVRGVVEGDRDPREHALILRLRVSSVLLDDGPHSAGGLLLLRLPLSVPYGDGDAIEARGGLADPPLAKGFDYRGYLAREGVYAEMDYPSVRLLRAGAETGWRHALVKLRERLADGVAQALPEPEASLGAGIALGTRRVIEPTLNQALTETGTAQIIVASGYNITIFTAFVWGVCAWVIGRRWGSIVTLAGIFAYTVFVGAYPSVARAAVMGGIFVFAQLVGRPHSGMRALIIASAVMVAVSPLALRDLSFLLSLSGTAGLFLFAQPLAGGIEWLMDLGVSGRATAADRAAGAWQRGIIVSASTTLSAMLGSLPVIAAAFHTLSLSALPANLLLFPAVPAIMAASGATAVAGALWHPAALVLAPIAYAPLTLMVLVVRTCARLPASQLELGWFGVPHAVGFATALLLAAWLAKPLCRVIRDLAAREGPAGATSGRLRSEHRGNLFLIAPLPYNGQKRIWPVLVAAGALIVTVTSGLLMMPRPLSPGTDPGRLRVTYLDVGAGSAILVQEGSQRLLVNTGPPGDATVRALDRVLPPWERSIHLVLLTQPNARDIGGLEPVARRYQIGAIMDLSETGAGNTGRESLDWRQAIAGSRTLELPTPATSWIMLGAWQIGVVQPGHDAGAQAAEFSSQSRSPATVVAALGERRVVLAGDPTAAVPADLRGVGRENAGAPQSPPRVAVIEATQAGSQGSETAPIAPWLNRSLVYRTTENGDVTIEVRERDLRVHVAHGPISGIGSGH